MGLFSSKKKTYVSSSVSNLSGDISNRPNILKTTVLSQAMYRNYDSYGDNLVTSYLNGSGMKFRAFGRWATKKNYYGATGMAAPVSSFVSSSEVDIENLQVILRDITSQIVSIKNIGTGQSEIEWWGDEYISNERPDLINRNYTVDYNEVSGLAFIEVYNDNDTDFQYPVESISFYPEGFVLGAMYLYIAYVIQTENEEGPLVFIPPKTVTAFRDVSTWQVTRNTWDIFNLAMREYTSTYTLYPGGTKSPTVEQTISTYNEEVSRDLFEYFKTMPDPENPSALQLLNIRLEQKIVPVVAYTMTVEKTQVPEGELRVYTYIPYIKDTYVETESRSEVVKLSWSNPQLYTYIKNSGNPALDAMFNTTVTTGKYFPIMPIKHGSFIVAGHPLYALNKEGFAKFSGTKDSYDTVIETIMGSSGVGNINHIYTMFGASINSKDNSAKQYIFNFFYSFYASNPNTSTAFNTYMIRMNQAKATVDVWEIWYKAQTKPEDSLYGKPEPVIIPYPKFPNYQFQITNDYGFNYTLSWASATLSVHDGKFKSNAKVGEVDISNGATTTINQPYIDELLRGSTNPGETKKLFSRDITDTVISYQETATLWYELTVNSLGSHNHIYRSKGVSLFAQSEMGQEEESGLIIPLNESSYKSMGLIKGTQFTTANAYLVFNAYKRVKRKWYQGGAFKIIIGIVAIVIAVVVPPAGVAAGAGGLLGGAAGTALGLTAGALTTAIVNATANAVAAMVLGEIIGKVAIKVVGGKLGAIVGAIATIAMTQLGSGGSGLNFEGLSRADTIIRFSGAVMGKLSKLMGEDLKALTKISENQIKQIEGKTAEIENKYYTEFGDRGLVDPLEWLHNSTDSYYIESPAKFLQRTLLLGSDIAEATQSMVTDFANINLELDVEV